MPDYYTTTSATANDTSTTWVGWSADRGTNTVTGVWTVWAGTDNGTGGAAPYRTATYPAPTPVTPPTEAELAAQATRQRERAKELKDREKERATAEKKAHRLLRYHLTPEQRREYQREDSFRIEVNGRCYRIRKGRAGNVDLIDAEGNRLRNYCIHPTAQVPNEDTMLAQKLLLEADEAAFLRTANMSLAYA